MRETCPLLEKLKADLITDIYTTGRVDGQYFASKKSKSNKNGIKEYIKGCLYKQHIGVDSQLVDDCYNELFIHLQQMSAAKILALRMESPRKLLATCLKIISFKCFAKDNRLGRPNHSLVESVRYASAFDGGNGVIHTTEIGHDDYIGENSAFSMSQNGLHKWNTLTSTYGDPEPFEVKNGFSVEAIVELMSSQEKAVFYQHFTTQRRGKKSTALNEERAKLYERVLYYKSQLQAV